MTVILLSVMVLLVVAVDVEVPQDLQNLAFGRNCAPHLQHCCRRGETVVAATTVVPHCLQNFAPTRNVAEHLVHVGAAVGEATSCGDTVADGGAGDAGAGAATAVGEAAVTRVPHRLQNLDEGGS